MKKYCVYLHTNKINGKKYVGQTCLKPERRWNNGIINKFAKECPGEDFVKGRLLSEDFRKKLSQVNKNKIPWNKKVKGE